MHSCLLFSASFAKWAVVLTTSTTRQARLHFKVNGSNARLVDLDLNVNRELLATRPLVRQSRLKVNSLLCTSRLVCLRPTTRQARLDRPKQLRSPVNILSSLTGLVCLTGCSSCKAVVALLYVQTRWNASGKYVHFSLALYVQTSISVRGMLTREWLVTRPSLLSCTYKQVYLSVEC